MSTSLRFRMMALFTMVFTALLACSYVAFYVFLRRELHIQTYHRLVETARPVVADLSREWRMQHVNQLNIPNEYFELLDATGQVLQKSKNLTAPLNLSGVNLDSLQNDFMRAKDGAGNAVRAVIIPFKQADQPRVLVVAIPHVAPGPITEVLEGFRKSAMPLFLVSILLTALVSNWYVRRSLKPITALTRQAATMTKRLTSGERFWTPLITALPHDEMGHLAETFNRLLETVDSTVRHSRQFVTDASHELRTPLSVLRGETELLLSKPGLPEEHRQGLLVVDDELKMLTRIVDGLFTLSMADAGQLRLEREPLYINEILEEVCSLVTPRGRAAGVAILRELNEEIPYVGDEAFLRELFFIFLDNAIKYSHAGSEVRVTLQKESGVVRVQFADQGIGIPREHLPKVFERFYRVGSRRNGETYSGGLGLAIADAIATAQGGSVTCQSELGVGSTFTLTLPLPAWSDTESDAESKQESIPS